MRRILLAAGAAVLTLAVVEITARVAARLIHRERGVRFDSELGWRPLPNVRKIGTVWGVERPASSNTLGWRDRERSIQKAAGTTRIIAIGDSFTFGTAVDDGERFTDVLERECGRAEFLNLSGSGYGPDQELRLLETEALRYQPDLVLVTLYLASDVTDLQHDRLYSLPKPYYRLREGRLELVKPQASVDVRLREASYVYELATRSFRGLIDEDHVAPEWEHADPLPLLQAVIARMADVAREHGVRFAAVLAYDRTQFANELTAQEAAARAIVKGIGIPVLDTYELFSPRVSAGIDLYAGRHWNPDGNALVARALCQWPEVADRLNHSQ